METLSKVLSASNGYAFHHLPAYLVILSTGYEVIYYNHQAEKLQRDIGKPVSAGVHFLSITPIEKKGLVASLLDQVKADQLPRSSEAEFHDGQGHSLFFEMIFHPVPGELGQVVQIWVLARDITMQKVFERKNAQLALELRHLIERANAFIFGLDSSGYITDWNNNCVEVTQFDQSEVLAQEMEFMIGEGYREDFRRHLKAILDGASMKNYELQIRTRREPVTVLLNATPKHNLTGLVVGAFFVGQDVTELVRYRHSLEDEVSERTLQLKEALRKERELVDIKNKFVAIASHEFKVPLRAMESGVNSLRSFVPSGEPHQMLLDMQKQIHHMRLLLDDVLTLEKGNVSLNVSMNRVDMVSFLRGAAVEVMRSTGGTHVIVLDFAEAECWIDSDEKMLRSIFVNLLSNAVKFSPMRDRVEVVMKRGRVGLSVQVTDRGIGIAAVDQERIFTPFNRGLNTQDIAGTGLGLTIVKKAVEMLNGDLSLESEVGVGTTVTVTLPLRGVRQEQQVSHSGWAGR